MDRIIRTILCPVGLDALDAAELAVAIEACRRFGARLILHHNLGEAPLGASTSWMWRQTHPNGGPHEEQAAERLREILAALPREIAAEAHISAGVAAPAIVEMADRLGADLVVMATHGAGNENHASIAEQVVERAACPVLILRQSPGGAALPLGPASSESPAVLLATTDFTAAGDRALAYAVDLARSLSMRLHLLHVVTTGRSLLRDSAVPVTLPGQSETAAEWAQARLAALVPGGLEHEVTVEVAIGDPAVQIAETAARQGASCILMGAHASGFLRSLFTRDTPREVLHRTSCPVWFVPAAASAASASRAFA